MTPAAIAKYIRRGYRYHVAENENVIVGIVGIRDNSHLYHLFVAESHQGRGMAKALWEKAMNEYTSSAFKQFGENWQKSMSQSGMESFKSYEEMMNKFTETWKSMWPKQ